MVATETMEVEVMELMTRMGSAMEIMVEKALADMDLALAVMVKVTTIMD